MYSAPKTGGKSTIFADAQMVPHGLVVDDKFVYWHTATALMKQQKDGGTAQTVYTPPDGAGLDGYHSLVMNSISVIVRKAIRDGR